jgi:PAS domain S-box-containing protein
MKLSSFPYRVFSTRRIEQLQQAIADREAILQSATGFVQAITRGQLPDLQTRDGDHPLKQQLLAMRQRMAQIAEQDKERNWISEGMARFVEVLRLHQSQPEVLFNQIVQHLVKYLHASQGGLFVLTHSGDQPVLELRATYAFDRQKYQQKTVSVGQGLLGQAVLEKETVYLTDIPTDYLRITSGLGQAPPTQLLIVPLKVNEQVLGVIELASFKEFKAYQREFVEKLGQSIASTLASIQVSEQTRQLLGESQQQAEALRAQEEEMRQNLEELSTTQEEMQRVLQQVQLKENYLTTLINTTPDSIMTINRSYEMEYCNNALRQMYSGRNFSIDKGFPVKNFFSDDQWPVYKGYYDRAFSGEQFEVTEHYKLDAYEAYFTITYSPVHNGEEIVGASVFAKDTTRLMVAQKETQNLLAQVQQQTEELKTQEEELRQQVEELSTTQEETERLLTQVQQQEAFYTSILNASQDVIVAFDPDYRITFFNQAFQDSNSAKGLQVTLGFNALLIFPESLRLAHQAHMDRTLAGESVQLTEHFKNEFTQAYYTFSYSPLPDKQGGIRGGAVSVKNVTELIEARMRAEQLLDQTRQANQELQQKQQSLDTYRQILEKKIDKASRLDTVFAKLKKNPAILNGEWDLAVELLTGQITKALAVNRASVWAYQPEHSRIRCLGLYDQGTGAHTQGGELSATDYPDYFSAILQEEIIQANHAITHPATACFTDTYLIPLGIESLLDIPYFMDGKLKGVICLEHGQAREWDAEEISFVSGCCDLLTLVDQIRLRKELEMQLRQKSTLS